MVGSILFVLLGAKIAYASDFLNHLEERQLAKKQAQGNAVRRLGVDCGTLDNEGQVACEEHTCPTSDDKCVWKASKSTKPDKPKGKCKCKQGTNPNKGPKPDKARRQTCAEVDKLAAGGKIRKACDKATCDGEKKEKGNANKCLYYNDAGKEACRCNTCDEVNLFQSESDFEKKCKKASCGRTIIRRRRGGKRGKRSKKGKGSRDQECEVVAETKRCVCKQTGIVLN